MHFLVSGRLQRASPEQGGHEPCLPAFWLQAGGVAAAEMSSQSAPRWVPVTCVTPFPTQGGRSCCVGSLRCWVTSQTCWPAHLLRANRAAAVEVTSQSTLQPCPLFPPLPIHLPIYHIWWGERWCDSLLDFKMAPTSTQPVRFLYKK